MFGIQALTTNPDTPVATFGLLGVLTVVFVETGLLVGFFLPGDSLLFTAGVLAAGSHPVIPLWLLALTVPVAAIAGDQCGFAIGAKAGPAVLESPGARRLGHHHLATVRRHFQTRGPATVVAARFLAVARTLAPVLAGASGMAHRTFTGYSVVGALAWGAGIPALGYLLGGIGFVCGHLDLILLAVVAVSVLPALAGLLSSRRRRRGARSARVQSRSAAVLVSAR